MEDEFPSPFCEGINLSTKVIQDYQYIVPLNNQPLKNGVVFELKLYSKCINHIVKVVTGLIPAFQSVPISSIKTKLNRLFEVKRKLSSKKKVSHCGSISELCEQSFDPPIKLVIAEPITTVFSELSDNPLTNNVNLDVDNLEVSSLSVYTQTDVPNRTANIYEKDANLCIYTLSKKKKSLEKIEKEIDSALVKLQSVKREFGHFSERNVKKRDEAGCKNLKLLREAQRKVNKQNKTILKIDDERKQLSCEIDNLKLKLNELLNVNEHVDKLVKKKIHAQKTTSYYKLSSNKLREKLQNNDNDSELLKSLKNSIDYKELKVKELETNVDILQEQLAETFQTKSNERIFTNNIRPCIIELSGLEVAVEKVSPVIATVSKHLFGRKLEKSELPTSTTVQSIVDEGHFLAKTCISEQLAETENWGLNRDGTTRRKKKILDTTVTLSSGDILSLGFNVVAHETAEAINNITKRHVTELATLHSNIHDENSDVETYIKSSLTKLAFTMSDRASNEKKADRLLDEWRDRLLNDCKDDRQHPKVLHFHCMAHVLLGFIDIHAITFTTRKRSFWKSMDP